MNTQQTVTDTSIIVIVDGTPDSARAIHWASELALMQGKNLVLADTGPDASAEIRLRAAAETAAAVRFTTVTVADHASPAVALSALASPRALLVVGAHRRGLISNLYTRRPIAESVVRQAVCPVVVVHPRRDRVGHHVVVAVIGDAPAQASLRFAYDYASWTGAPLTVLHCFWDVTRHVGVLEDVAAAPNEHRQLAEAVAGLGEDYPDVPVTLQLAHGFPELLIDQSAESAKMVVIGTSRLGRITERLVGSSATWALNHAVCDVAVVHEPAGDPQSS